MLKSMTGFGKSSRMIKDKNVAVEIRALNSKYLDFNIKLPASYKDKELALKKILSASLIRGKIEMQVEIDAGESKLQHINKKVFGEYYNELSNLADEFGISKNDMLDIITRIPDVFLAEDESSNEEEWKSILSLINAAVAQLDEFRNIEGAQLAKDMSQRISSIQEIKNEIEKVANGRTDKIRKRIIEGLANIKNMVKMDEARLEQEMIFFLEKLDITEELVRLQSHCSYFEEIIDDETASKGKKLAFVLQEMGREINTIGSKAYDAPIQRMVVQMKDELEKIKEQINNIL